MRVPGFSDSRTARRTLLACGAVLAVGASGCTGQGRKINAAPLPQPSVADVSKAIGGSCLTGYETHGFVQAGKVRTIDYLPIIQRPRTGTTNVVISVVKYPAKTQATPYLSGEIITERAVSPDASIGAVVLQFAGPVTAADLPKIQANLLNETYQQRMLELENACVSADDILPQS